MKLLSVKYLKRIVDRLEAGESNHRISKSIKADIEEYVDAYKQYLDIKQKTLKETDQDKRHDLFMQQLRIGDKYNF